MDAKQDFIEALSYFTMPNHQESFEVLAGEGKVMLSAPHAVLQTRDGRLKQAERYTGMLCRLLNQRINCPCIYKARHMGDDANHDPISDYRDALCDYVAAHDIRCLLDLHQLSPDRPMAVCLGTGHGRNLCHDAEVLPWLTAAFADRDFSPLTVDEPFSAGGAYTVSATVAARCHIPGVQIELNTRLLSEDSSEERFAQVEDALQTFIRQFNDARK